MKEWQKVTLTQFGLKNNDILSDICDGGMSFFLFFEWAFWVGSDNGWRIKT
jgi:hypothetical protein